MRTRIVSSNYPYSIFIIGGSGFVGTWLNRTFPNTFNHFCALNKHEYNSNFNNWRHEKWTHIIHLAPIAPTKAIECAKRNNARLLFASSGAVYHPEYQDRIYRQNKLNWERECLESGVDVVIARLFTFMDSSRAWKAIFSDIRAGRTPEVWNNCTRSFMHGSEMARWLWAILLHGESRQAYDVGSDRAITMPQLADRIELFTGCKFKRYNDADVPMPVYLPEDTAKTRALLNA